MLLWLQLRYEDHTHRPGRSTTLVCESFYSEHRTAPHRLLLQPVCALYTTLWHPVDGCCVGNASHVVLRKACSPYHRVSTSASIINVGEAQQIEAKVVTLRGVALYVLKPIPRGSTFFCALPHLKCYDTLFFFLLLNSQHFVVHFDVYDVCRFDMI